MSGNINLQGQFELAISGYLKHWSVVQLIISHGFGGNLTNEKIDWFTTTAVPQIFYENGNLFPDDVEYYLSHILFHEFDAVIEDGSLEETSRKLIELYELYKNGNLQLLQNQVNLYNPTVKQMEEPGIVEGMNAMEISAATSVDRNSSASHGEFHQNANITNQEVSSDNDNDGWQIVQSRKNKKR